MIFFFAFFFFLLGSDTKEMNKTPLKPTIQLQEIITLNGGDEGFYDGIQAFPYNEHYYIYDMGNKSIITYDKNGNETFRFGKEGNGPGELQGYEQIAHVNDDYIYLFRWDKLFIFSKNGQLVKEIMFAKHIGSTPLIHINKTILLAKEKKPKLGYVEFDLKGNLIKEVKSDTEETAETLRLTDVKANIQEWMLGMSPHFYFNTNLIRYERGDYKIYIYNHNVELLKILTRPFDRIKVAPSEERKFIITGDKKRDKELNAKYFSEYINATGGFEPAIESITGYYKNYLVVQVASEEKEKLIFDIISPDGTFYSQLILSTDQTAETFQTPKMINDQFVVVYKNEEIGPYCKIYDIKL